MVVLLSCFVPTGKGEGELKQDNKTINPGLSPFTQKVKFKLFV